MALAMDCLMKECLQLDISASFLFGKLASPTMTLKPVEEIKVEKIRQKKKNRVVQRKEPKITQKPKQAINPSKRHRDRLNTELDNLAKLLPFPEDVIARLDKLSILRLSVSYLRNKNFFKGANQDEKTSGSIIKNLKTREKFAEFFNQALDGFILVVTLDGEVFYVSDRVKEYLGYSQSQVLHQPFETLVHDDDKEEVNSMLKGITEQKIVELDENDEAKDDLYESHSDQQRDFVLRLKSVLNNSNSADMYKSFRLTGMIRRLNMEPDVENLRYALFGFCTPARSSCSVLELRMKTTLFCSKNRIDLSFLDLDSKGREIFGYSKKDLFGCSSYVLVHRQDLQHLRCKHSEIMLCGRSSLATFRLMDKNNGWNWVSGYARVIYKNGKPDFIVTTNRVMNEEEAQTMLKLRDDADLNALAKLGLVEPDDPKKALEIGFPNFSISTIEKEINKTSPPMPMPLGGPIAPPAEMRKEPISSPPSGSDMMATASLPKESMFESSNMLHNTHEQLILPTPPLSLPIGSTIQGGDFHSNNMGSPTGSHISGKTSHSRGSINSTSSLTSDVMMMQMNEASIKQEVLSHSTSSSSPYGNTSENLTNTLLHGRNLSSIKSTCSNNSNNSTSPNLTNTQAYFYEQQQQQQDSLLRNMQNTRQSDIPIHPHPPLYMPNMAPPNYLPPTTELYHPLQHHQSELTHNQSNMNNRDISQVNTTTHNMFPYSNNRLQYSPYEQTGPNVTVNAPEYPDLTVNMQLQAQNSRHRMFLSSQNRPVSVLPDVFESSWNRAHLMNNVNNTPREMLAGGNPSIYSNSADFMQNSQYPSWM